MVNLMHKQPLITLKELGYVPTPASKGSHFPIPHARFARTVREALLSTGTEIAREQHAIDKEGQRYFGLLDLKRDTDSDYGLTVGIRNSHDKTFAAGLCAGNRVFICDNLSFSNEIVLARRHTRYIGDDLQRLVFEAVGKLGEAHTRQDARIARYKERRFHNNDVHDFVIRSVDAKIIPNARVPEVLGEWRKESATFGSSTAWKLFNAYTEVMKRYTVEDLPRRTIRLHGMMDTSCGVN